MVKSKYFDREIRYLETVAEHREDKIGSAVFYTLDVIDGKSQSLLTHVSVMMAILTLFYGESGEQQWIKLAILVELILYIIVTFGCLRAIFIVMPMDAKVSSGDVLKIRISECITRRNVYRNSLIATYIITFAFLATVAMHAVLRGLPFVNITFW